MRRMNLRSGAAESLMSGFITNIDVTVRVYRTVLLLYYGEGFSVREISTLLSLKEETVKTRLKRGRSAVRMAYEAE